MNEYVRKSFFIAYAIDTFQAVKRNRLSPKKISIRSIEWENRLTGPVFSYSDYIQTAVAVMRLLGDGLSHCLFGALSDAFPAFDAEIIVYYGVAFGVLRDCTDRACLD